jgi:amine acid ABC transporter, permease protein, 3-TM region, His/Glu/Gln/Arg/opine family
MIYWLEDIYTRFYNAIIPDKRYLAYLEGLQITLTISLFAVILGVCIGIFIAILKVAGNNSKNKLVKFMGKLGSIYVTVVRGTPLIVQLLIIYSAFFTSRTSNPKIAGIVCFGINSGAYVAEIFRAGIESIDIGQTEAGRSLGLSAFKTMWHIILPQAIKNILPALGNEFIVLVKETSVVSIIAVSDLTKQASFVVSRTFDVLPPYIITAAMYLIIVIILTFLLNQFEKRLKRSDKR